MTRFFLFLNVTIIFTFTACSQSGGITTNLYQIDLPNMTDSSHIFVSDTDINGNPIAGFGAMGLFHAIINPDSLSGEFTSLRKTALVDTLEIVDITNFLLLAPCTDCVNLKSVRLNEFNNLVLNIGIKHPFDYGDPFKPVTGRNRADLHVFNVEGTVVMKTQGNHVFNALNSTVSDSTLINADGFTPYLNTVIEPIFSTNANIHPYILHFDDYSQGNFNPESPTGFESVTNPLPYGNLVMPMGSDFDFKDYIFNIPDNSDLEFIFAVGCTYAVSSSSKAQRFSPEFRVPQHNKKAPSEVRVEIASNDLVAGVTSSTADLFVKILDINHGVDVGDSLDQMAFDSSVSNIFVEIPGVTSGYQNVFSFIDGDGRDPLNPLTFLATITNSDGATDGTYKGLVKVLDSYPTGQNTSPLLNALDGIQRVDPLDNPLSGLFEVLEFATYATFEISISSVPQDPIAIIHTTPDPAETTTQFPEIIFDGSDSYDPDGGVITLFEWDFDWDGDPANFNPSIVGYFPIVSHSYYCHEQNYVAALRVSDDDTPTGISEIESVNISVVGDYEYGSFSSTFRLGQDQTIRGSDIYHTGQVIRVDSTGIAHIITKSSSGIHYRTFDGSSLSSGSFVPDMPANPGTISIAVDRNDEIHVFCQTSNQIRHNFTNNGNFNASSNIISTAQPGHGFSMMNVEVNVNKDIMLTWYDQDAEYYGLLTYSLDTGSGFSTPDTAGPLYIRYTTNGSGLMTSFRMTSTPDGNFHYIYRRQTADMSYQQRIYDMVYDGSSWQPPRECSTNVLTDLNAIAGIDGSIHITGRNHGTNYMEYIRYDPINDQWMPNMVIAYNSNPWIAGPMGTIMIAPNGYVHSIFVERNDKLIHVKPFCNLWNATDIQNTPDFVIDSALLNQTYGHADAAWDLNGNLLIVHQDEFQSDPYLRFETVLNVLSFN